MTQNRFSFVNDFMGKNRFFFLKVLIIFGVVFQLTTALSAKPLTGSYIQRYLLLSSELEKNVDKFMRDSLRVYGQEISQKEKFVFSAEELKQQRALFLDELPDKIGKMRKTARKLRNLQPSRGAEKSRYWIVVYTQRNDEMIDEIRRGLYRGQINKAKLKTLNNARKFAAANAERAMSRYLDAQPVRRN